MGVKVTNVVQYDVVIEPNRDGEVKAHVIYRALGDEVGNGAAIKSANVDDDGTLHMLFELR